MKLLRYGAKGAEKPGLMDAQGAVRDLSGELSDITNHTLTPHSLQRLRELDPSSLPVVANPGRMALPWAGCGKFIAVGLNYADHAAESNLPVPTEPVLFTRILPTAEAQEQDYHWELEQDQFADEPVNPVSA